MLEHIGRVLGDRYRIVAPIGAGASALVFLADDVVLRRQVAVKLLHEGLIGDQRFLERFRSEAQTTASLNHQHLVAVHDWGHDDVPYLVTEYLAGGSLQTMLDTGHQLSRSQALLVGLEASRALDYAHKRGLIHRDIKPSNLLFGEDGRLRIADFGLARALAEASITEPVGAVLGSARYASPEQARGEQVDEKSDVYSLALVLVEAVTGVVPFAADTMVAMLMGRIDNPIPVPDDLGALQEALRLAGQVDPEVRPDAATLAALILETAELLPRPEPLPLAGALNTPLGAELSPTDMGTRSAQSADDVAPVAGELSDDVAPVAGELSDDAEASAAAVSEVEGPGFRSGQEIRTLEDLQARDTAADVALPVPDSDLPPEVEWNDFVSSSDLSKPEPDVIPATPIPPATPVEAAAAVEPEDDLFPRTPLFFDPVDPTIDQPEVSDAAPIVAAAPVTTVMPRVETDVSEPGSEIAMSRRQERRAARDQRRVQVAEANAAGADEARDDQASLLSILVGFVLLIGLGAGLWYLWQTTEIEDVALPDLSGRTYEELGPLIGENDWEVVVLEGRENGSTPGQIIAQSPAEGTLLERGDEVRVTLSIGNAMVTIPTELPGVGLEEARLRLNAVGLEIGEVSNIPSESVPVGGIVRVDEAAFELPQGDDVDLVLSDGPVPRFVPDDLVGIDVADARDRLLELRLDPQVVTDFSYEIPIDVVMEVSPEPGTEVEVGTAVGLFVSLGPEPIEVPDVLELSLEEATNELEAVLLCVDRVDGRTTPDALVIATEPPAGEIVTDPTDCLRIVTSTAEPDDEE